LLTLAGIASVAISSIVALYQKKMKRLLAYSAVGHVGFILLAFSSGKLDSVKSSIIYLLIYMVMSLGLFSLLIAFSTKGFLFKFLIN
jgi:NADH-quinone oxidoreductase subunit N